MSDTEDEPFDREAEKEKLREQLAAEEESRQATQHMSELLLKGATMTNHHCDECGDPLFRHEGREFCPTCGRQRAAGGGAAATEGEEATQAAGDGGTAAATGSSSEPADQHDHQHAAPAGGATAPTQQPATGAGGTPGQPTGEADLPGARAALARKVTALAREAEATSDVGRARELLAAVREGAEALRALDGRDR